MSGENQIVALSVVVPSYNEESRIGKTLREVDAYLKKQKYTSEVIVVDDGSKDSTVQVVLAHAARVRNVRLLRFDRNQGKGWAVREGMLQARGRYRLFMDADGSTAIDHWDAMKEELDTGTDIVIGSRHVKGSELRIPQAPLRQTLGHTFRLLVRIMFGMPIHDTQNGFKAFQSHAAARIFGNQKVPGWAFDVEILSIAKRLDYSMTEVPITWIDDTRSRMTFSAMPKMLTDLLRIRLRMVQPRPAYRLNETPQVVQLS